MSEKIIKVGIAGLGRAGINMHCPELKSFEDKYKVVAGCDIDASRLTRLKELHPECKTYESIEEMLQDDNIDLVSIATRSPEHTPHAKLALAAGKIVFLEKPIALNYEQALELKAASEEYPGKLYLRHNRRFEPAFQHIREIMATGILGDVYEIKLRRNGYQRRNDWQTIIKCGGGQMNNWGPHIIDHGLRLLESPVKEIWSSLKLVAAVGDAEDHLKVILTGENDRVIDLEISGGSAIGEPQYVVSGSRGALTCDGSKITMKYLDPEVQLANIDAIVESPPIDGGFGNAEKLQWIDKEIDVAPEMGCKMNSIWEYMYDSIINGSKFPITIDEAIEVVRVSTECKKGTPFEG